MRVAAPVGGEASLCDGSSGGGWTGDQIAGLQPELGGDAVATAPLMHKDLRDLAPTGRGHPDGLI